MNTMMRKRLWIAFFLAAFVTVIGAGCRNTAHGFGEDMENAGQKIEKKTD
jgi:predicted small secreted protein